MIANRIIKDFDGWDEMDEECTIYYNVILQDDYEQLNTSNSEIDLYIDGQNGLIELINRDDEAKSKTYEIDVLTFKEKV